jgi:phosphatidylglycerophosphate synthase
MATEVWQGPGPFRPALALGAGAQLALLILLWVTVGLGLVGWLVGAADLVVTFALLGYAFRRHPSRSLGPANLVTLTRVTLIGGVTALVADRLGHPAPVVLVVLAAVAVVLDGVDGKVARRTGTVSEVGARFDMEADAFLILVLSVFVAPSLGLWTLAIGLMRYAYVAASWVAPWMRLRLPVLYSRKVVAVVQMVTLVVASAGVLPHLVAVAVVALALASLTWSFGRDVWWQWQRRHVDPRWAGSPT